MLSNSAVTVKLSISRFGMRKKDKTVTDETNRTYNAAETAGNYNKALLNPKAPTIMAIQSAVSSAKKYHNTATLPWGNAGERCLPAEMIMEYRDQMDNIYKPAFDQAVYDFVKSYDTLKLQAQNELGTMYNDEDYPPADEVEGAFDFKISVEPIADPSDFRIKIHDKELEKLKEEYAKENGQKQAAAMAHLWQRLYDSVQKMAETLSEDDKIFRDTLVGNIVSLTNILPKLNVTNDPNLEAMGKEVLDTLCQYEPKELRKDKATRKVAATQAKGICNAMAGYMGGQPANLDQDQEEGFEFGPIDHRQEHQEAA